MTPETLALLDAAARSHIRCRREIIRASASPYVDSDFPEKEFKRDRDRDMYYAARAKDEGGDMLSMWSEIMDRALDMSILETERIICG